MPKRSNIRRVRVALESSFGIDGTGTMGDFGTLRVTQIEHPREAQEFIEDNIVRPFRVAAPASQLGWERGSLTVGGQLVPTGILYDKDAVPAIDALGVMLKAILGGQVASAGSLVATGTSPTAISVTASEGARFQEGKMCAVETGVGTGLYEVTGIDTRSTDALTFCTALSFTPSVGARVLNADLYYETDQPAQTLQWLIEGEDRNDIWLYTGANGALTIEWPLGGEIAWSSSQMFCDRIHDDELATPQGGSAMAQWTPAGGSPVIARNGEIIFAPASGTLRTKPNIAALTFDPGITWQEVPSFNGVEGRAGWERVTGQPMATIQVPRDAAAETYKDAMAAGTVYRLLAQAGVAGGRILALHLPSVQIVGITPQSLNGLDYLQLSLRCLPDSGLTDQSTDLLRAQYRLARI